MKGQFGQVIRKTVAAAFNTPAPTQTRRDASPPPISGKAIAVTGSQALLALFLTLTPSCGLRSMLDEKQGGFASRDCAEVTEDMRRTFVNQRKKPSLNGWQGVTIAGVPAADYAKESVFCLVPAAARFVNHGKSFTYTYTGSKAFSFGTAFRITDDGYCLTAAHCVDDEKMAIRIYSEKGGYELAPVRVVDVGHAKGSSGLYDIAILHCPALDQTKNRRQPRVCLCANHLPFAPALPLASWGGIPAIAADRSVSTSEKINALGNVISERLPAKLPVIAAGWGGTKPPHPAFGGKIIGLTDLSAISIPLTDGRESLAISNIVVDHSAPVGPGDSGGPLLNAQGEVVAVNIQTSNRFACGTQWQRFLIHSGLKPNECSSVSFNPEIIRSIVDRDRAKRGVRGGRWPASHNLAER